MNKWEYKNKFVEHIGICDDELNDLGKDGWEVVSIINSYKSAGKILLKRKLN